MRNKYANISPSRSHLITKLYDGEIRGKSVVEFGASSGETLRDLKKNYDCDVISYDLLPVDLDFCDSIYFDLDSLDFHQIEDTLKRCEIVLFLDVLEHAKSPKDIIERILEINNNITILMVSPNFQSIRMLLAWYKGIIPEEESGYFDRTHIKWLSPRWLRDCLSSSIYESKTFYIFSSKRYFNIVQRLWPNRLCSQFSAIIKKRKCEN